VQIGAEACASLQTCLRHMSLLQSLALDRNNLRPQGDATLSPEP